MGMTAVINRWLANPVLRAGLVLAGVILGVLVAVLFPDTPDELSRIEAAYAIRDAGYYNSFFWPPGNVLIIVANPLLGSGLTSDVVAVRLMNLLIAMIPLCLLLLRTQNALIFLATILVAPYAFLVLSTASQQGLMIGLFAILVWAIAERRLLAIGLTAFPLFLVNPAMILALPAAFLVATLGDRWFLRAFLVSALAYLPILVAAILLIPEAGRLLPTLAANGPVNVFLGNNPDPLSHRGVGDIDGILAAYGIVGGSHLDAVLAFLKDDPIGFVGNLLTKAVLYWMPWDFLRSGMGQGVSSVLFAYIGFAQVVIYATFFLSRRHLAPGSMLFAILFCLAAWGLYSLFFVKVRFRVPFDMLLLLSALVAFQPKREQK